jgi:hypothetical protein
VAGQAKAAMGVEALDVLADRGYFKGEEVLACEPLGVTPYVPKPLTSGSKAAGRFSNAMPARLHQLNAICAILGASDRDKSLDLRGLGLRKRL